MKVVEVAPVALLVTVWTVVPPESTLVVVVVVPLLTVTVGVEDVELDEAGEVDSELVEVEEGAAAMGFWFTTGSVAVKVEASSGLVWCVLVTL